MATKLRIKDADNGNKEIVVLMEHPMHTGAQKDKDSQKLIPAHFIQRVVLELNGKMVAEVFTGVAVSADPLLSFQISNAKNGDKVKITWWDNRKQTESAEKIIEA